MMKKYIYFFVLILIVVNLSFSQDYQLRETMDFFQSSKTSTADWKLAFTKSDIKGSPFLNDDFVQGTVYTTSKTKYVGLPLRYNAYNDQLEFKTSDGQLQTMSQPETVEKIEFGEYNMVYIPYFNAKKIHHGYFIVLEEGKASLYLKSEVIFKEAEKPAAYHEAEPASFIKKPDCYYIRIGLEQAKKVDNKKELIAVFPDHNNEIEAFIKKNKIKASKPDSIIKVVKYYNSL